MRLFFSDWKELFPWSEKRIFLVREIKFPSWKMKIPSWMNKTGHMETSKKLLLKLSPQNLLVFYFLVFTVVFT